jgi:hypothetical protein
MRVASKVLGALLLALCSVAIAQDNLRVIAPQQRLTPLPFGVLTSIEVHRDFVFVGSAYDRVAATRQGIVHVFAKAPRSDCAVEECWRMTQTLFSPGIFVGDRFGEAIEYDGRTLMIGSPGYVNPNGRVFVYERQNDAFVLTQELRPSGSEPDELNFGARLALDGNRAATTSAAWTYPAAAYVFKRARGGEWTQEARLTPVNQDFGDQFGISLDLRARTLIVGADVHRYAAIFLRRGTSWEEVERLSAPSPGVDEFGRSVELSARSAFIGDFVSQGVFVYERMGDEWTFVETLVRPEDNGLANFGAQVQLSKQRTLFIGAAEGVFAYKKVHRAWIPLALFSDGGTIDNTSEEHVDTGARWLGIISSAGASMYDISAVVRPREAE